MVEINGKVKGNFTITLSSALIAMCTSFVNKAIEQGDDLINEAVNILNKNYLDIVDKNGNDEEIEVNGIVNSSGFYVDEWQLLDILYKKFLNNKSFINRIIVPESGRGEIGVFLYNYEPSKLDNLPIKVKGINPKVEIENCHDYDWDDYYECGTETFPDYKSLSWSRDTQYLEDGSRLTFTPIHLGQKAVDVYQALEVLKGIQQRKSTQVEERIYIKQK